MSQFPIVSEEGLYEAVNYLASGPAGLGQNFSGFSAYQPAYVNGTFRQPFTTNATATNNPPQWYVSGVAINSVTPLNVVDGKAYNAQWNFTTAQSKPPFTTGQTLTGSDFEDSSTAGDFYNGEQGTVLTCSTTSVIMQTGKNYAYPTITTYGTLGFDNRDVITSTDANARVTITGPTQQVFISSQCQWNSEISYSTSSQFDLVVQINRYVGSIDTAGQGAIDYLFSLDQTISEQIHRFSTGSTSTNTTVVYDAGQNIFTTVIDQPSFGYYWYIAEVEVVTTPTYKFDSQGNLVTGGANGRTASGTGSGTTGTFTSLTPINVSSSGSGAIARVRITSTNTNYSDSASVRFTTKGTGYSVGDKLKILGTDIGGTSPANDMNLTLTSVQYPGDATPYTQTIGLRSLTAQVIKQ